VERRNAGKERATSVEIGAVVVSHIILISAQVTTKRGVPVLQEVTFGAFAEMQRAATAVFGNARETWQNYFALQQIRQENDRLKKEVTQLRVALQQERTVACSVVSGIALSDEQIPHFLAAADEFQQIDSNGDLILHGAFVGADFRF